MTTTPRSPTRPRRAAGWIARGVVLLAIGVAAYYGLELADRMLVERLAGAPERGAIEVVDLPPIETPATATGPGAPRHDGPGNQLLKRAALALDARGSISVPIRQVGWIDGRETKTQGVYRQLGGGAERRFLMELTGELAGAPTRLLRVSDGKFLWTDFAWGENPSEPQRALTRIDLRKVRRAITGPDPPEPGEVSSIPPSDWSRLGGLPMLMTGLDAGFTFGQPRWMLLRDERVMAVVGRWRPESLEALSGDGTRPERAPHHVVVALAESTLFPLLVEYRAAGDPLTRDGLPDEALLTASRRPLLKIDFATPTFGERLDPRLFTYQPSERNWDEATDRELRLVRHDATQAR